MGDRADGWARQSVDRNAQPSRHRTPRRRPVAASIGSSLLCGLVALAVADNAVGQILRLPADDDFVRRSGIMVPNQPHRLREMSQGAGPRLHSPLDSGSVVNRRAWLAAGELYSTAEVKRVRLIELDALIRATLIPSNHLQRLVTPTKNVRVINRQDWESDGAVQVASEPAKDGDAMAGAGSDASVSRGDVALSWRSTLVRPSGYGPAPAYDYLLALSSDELRSRPDPDLEVCRQAIADGRQQANLGRWSAAEVFYTEAWLHLPESDRQRIFSQLVGY